MFGANDALRRLGVDAQRLSSPSQAFPMWLVDSVRFQPERAWSLLSDEERARADRFRTSALRARYVAAHGSLRTLLHHCSGVGYNDLRMDFNPFGKPRLAGFPKLHFNISYGGPYVLIGMGLDNEIGVDIEVIRPISDASELMQLHYTRGEQMELWRARMAGLPVSSAFLRIWTRKEACVKALGSGLDIPLSQVECGLGEEVETIAFGDARCRTGTMTCVDDAIMSWARRTP